MLGSVSCVTAGLRYANFWPLSGPPHPLPPLLELGHSSPILQGQLQTRPSAKLIPQQVVGPSPGASGGAEHSLL